MEEVKEYPTLIVETHNGTVIKVYQVLSPEFVKEIIDEFLVEKKFVNPNLVF
jgi:(2Fe-2S) ferredoxin